MYSDPAAYKAALRAHYQKNKATYLARSKAMRLRITSYIRGVKTDKPCKDCRIFYPPYVLDFDHRDPSKKRMHVSGLKSRGSLKAVQEEIEKCDIVCANCHRIRTFAGKPELAPEAPVG